MFIGTHASIDEKSEMICCGDNRGIKPHKRRDFWSSGLENPLGNSIGREFYKYHVKAAEFFSNNPYWIEPIPLDDLKSCFLCHAPSVSKVRNYLPACYNIPIFI